MFNHRRTLLLREAIDAFLTELALAGRAKTTQELYRCLLTMLARELGPTQPVRSISRSDIIHYLSRLSKNDSQTYVNLNLRVFKRFLAWLVEQGELKQNPLEGMTAKEPPWTPVPPFTRDECQRLLSAARSPLEKAVVPLLLDTGLRASELADLQLENVNLTVNELTVRGKGGMQRKVALNPGPRKALLGYFKAQAGVGGLLWPEGFDRKKLAYLLDKVGRRAGVARVHPHRFRHTFACRLLAATGDSLALKKLLGHSSMTMVLRYTESKEGDRAITVHRKHSLVA